MSKENGVNTKQSYPILILVFFLIWILAILFGYYLYHKPLSLQTATAFVRTMWSLLTGFWILSLSVGLGRHIQRRMGFGENQNPVLPAALGMGAFSLTILFLGLLSFQFKYLLWLLFIVPVPFVWRQSIAFWKQIWMELRSFTIEHGISRWFLLLLGIILVLSLLPALSPPVHYDALTYHLALPRQYIDSNGISPELEWLRSGMPQTGEMIFTWALSAGNDSIPAVIGWMFATITLFG